QVTLIDLGGHAIIDRGAAIMRVLQQGADAAGDQPVAFGWCQRAFRQQALCLARGRTRRTGGHQAQRQQAGPRHRPQGAARAPLQFIYSHDLEARRRVRVVQPLAALFGIIMGSSVALLAGLIMTLLVFALLPEFHDRLSGEFRPLAKAIAWAILLTGTSAAAFWSEVKRRPWRLYAAGAMAIAVALVTAYYWPD